MRPAELDELPCAYCGDALGDGDTKVLNEDQDGTPTIAVHAQCYEAQGDDEEHPVDEEHTQFIKDQDDWQQFKDQMKEYKNLHE